MENERVAEAEKEQMEVAEDWVSTEQQVVANINVMTIDGDEGAVEDKRAIKEPAADQEQRKQMGNGETQKGPAIESQNELKAREAFETLAMLSKPANTFYYNKLCFTRYDKAKMEAKMYKPISFGKRQLVKLEVRGTTMFTGGFERPDTFENPMPIWDIKLILLQIIEFYPKKRVRTAELGSN